MRIPIDSLEIALAVIGVLVGCVGTILWQAWIGVSAASSEELLTRHRRGKLNAKGKIRLREEYSEAVKFLRLRLPPTSYSQDLTWEFKSTGIIPASDQSRCPSRLNSRDEPLLITVDSTKMLGPAVEAALSAVWDAADSRWDIVREFADQPDTLLFWIYAPSVLSRDLRQVAGELKSIGEVLHKRFPRSRFVLEAPLPSALVRRIRAGAIRGVEVCNVNPKSPQADEPRATEAQAYAADRDILEMRLAAGMTLDVLIPDQDRPIPEGLLLSRIPAPRRLHWRIIRIEGPPGSGKSALASRFAADLVDDERAIVMNVGAPSVLARLRSELQQVDANVINAIAAALAPSLAKRSGRPVFHTLAAEDALVDVLADTSRRFVLFGDDLSTRQDLRAMLVKILELDTEHRFSFLFAGRTLAQFGTLTDSIDIDCRLWSRDEATVILRSWVQPGRAYVVQHWLQESWLKNRQDHFSTYLLGAILESSEDLDQSPSSLIRAAITRHVRAMLELIPTEVVLRDLDPAEQLARIRFELQRGTPHNQIFELLDSGRDMSLSSLINDLGMLSWVARFDNQQDVVDPSRASNWVPRWAPINVAEDILRAGVGAGILNESPGGGIFRFQNKLVIDGCAAIYLADVVASQQNHRNNVAQMINRLDDAGSVDILTLTLDDAQFFRVLDAVLSGGPAAASAADKLFTQATTDRLGSHPDWLDSYAHLLWQSLDSVEASLIAPLARGAAKLARSSPNFHGFLFDQARRSGESSTRALTVLAYTVPDPAEFLLRTADIAPVAVMRAVSGVWNQEMIPMMLDYTIRLLQRQAEGPILRIWQEYLSRCDGRSALGAVGDITRRAVVMDDPTEDVFVQLLKSCFARAWQEKPKGMSELMEDAVHCIPPLSAARRLRLAEEVVWWFALFHDFVDPAVDLHWIVTPMKGFAVPQVALAQSTIPAILAKVLKSRRWALPHSADLLVSEAIVEGPELVADALPRDYRSGDALRLGQVKTWDGRRLEIVPSDDIMRLAVRWRPKLILDIEGEARDVV